MRLSFRVFLGFFLIVGLCAYFLMSTFLQEVRPGVRQGLEVALVDTANLLAELAQPEVKAGTVGEGAFARAVAAYRERELKARIWDVEKRDAEFRVYVTDAKGLLLFDSGGEKPGKDYSRWNDVYRTLRGEYGARATRGDPRDESTSSLHVAAPILDDHRLVGVLTVVAPSASVLPYAERSQKRVWKAGLGLMGGALLIGLALAGWLTQSIGQLQRYARQVTEGRKAHVPVLSGELAELGRALETMREKLEGRQYVEHYVHTLTHEMKSPLAAIRGAGELLEEEMPEADRQRFLANIREQEVHLRKLLDRLLSLASVEQRRGLHEARRLEVRPWAERVAATKEVPFLRRGVKLDVSGPEGLAVIGEAFLLEQALSNLLDNALEFSPEGGRVQVGIAQEGGEVVLRVRDEGPGIPGFALDRVFEPFFSLPRPGTGKKSTGLGLSFVREVAALHGGTAGLESSAQGATAMLRLPLG